MAKSNDEESVLILLDLSTDFGKVIVPFSVKYTMLFSSLIAQLVKTLPAMWETRVRSLGWEDPLKEGMAIHSSTLAGGIPMERGAWWATVHAVTKSQTRLSD